MPTGCQGRLSARGTRSARGPTQCLLQLQKPRFRGGLSASLARSYRAATGDAWFCLDKALQPFSARAFAEAASRVTHSNDKPCAGECSLPLELRRSKRADLRWFVSCGRTAVSQLLVCSLLLGLMRSYSCILVLGLVADAVGVQCHGFLSAPICFVVKHTCVCSNMR